tara:strand:+ start:3518 stop:4270 length:753 start_codon:yes stop_codon:yes gene_type:complete
MPKVGTKSFPYTKEGEQRAAAYAAATEQEVVNDNSFGYARGGLVGMQEGGEISMAQKLAAMGAGVGMGVLSKNLSLAKQAALAASGGLAAGVGVGKLEEFENTVNRQLAGEIPYVNRGKSKEVWDSYEKRAVQGHEGAEASEDPKLDIDQMAKPYLQQYLQAGVPQSKAYWLALIDIGNDPQTKYRISENPRLSEMYNGLFAVNNVNAGDIKEHRQTRSALNLESPHLDASESERPEDIQVGIQAGKFGF